MKKCMSGCGGKMMSKGGKVSPVKKMQNGGALKPLGAKIGVGTNIAGAIGMGVKAISDAVKAKREKKKALTEENTEPVTETKKRGGAKYQKGGIAKQTIVGMPGYNARTDTMKKGGSAKKKYQSGGYANTTQGELPDYSKMKKGGTKKYAKGGSTFGMLSVKAGIDKNPKPTAADRIAGAKKKKK